MCRQPDSANKNYILFEYVFLLIDSFLAIKGDMVEFTDGFADLEYCNEYFLESRS